MLEVNPACFTLYKSQRRFDRVVCKTYGSGPLVIRAPWNIADHTLSSCIHHPIHHVIKRSITAITDHQMASLTGCLPGQFQRLAPVGLQGDVCFASGCTENGDQIGHMGDVLPHSEINHDAGMLFAHNTSSFALASDGFL
jgi:hypothetical protein